MAKFYDSINKRVKQFIEEQKMFFVATAPKEGRINLSPKGMDTFKILDDKKVAWLSVTGSGNETSAHLLENGRITIMFCAFNGAPNILRIYGSAIEVLPENKEWNQYISLFPELPGTRQIFIVEIETVQTSCGMSLPYYEYQGERNQLNEWAENKGESGINTYWDERNQVSIDGLKTKLYKD
ncbi:Pyridoxamine 5'-phosphate oxidase [Tenacibaculum sp. MAR_2009_124]|uniref:pyridoxamine 5'-phosphate oxidase family protein n=1 Tax=Tenacibaculum sp. MAR_2009_124 TaxID=1250059 RepID=UPI0008989A33|nr:pyridoxamine 5'-phosphate oxidase family protein [Tenacibaculum sp. MAR_2009_124]SEC48504.1 Pyridoxamine 5'-phosphate oxidase [Tenacibaculum sp. MAR_2009_124]